MIICENAKLKKAAEFYAKELDIEKFDVKVELKALDANIGGRAFINSSGIAQIDLNLGVSILPGFSHPLEILAHEMIHAKQLSTGELSYYSDIEGQKTRIKFKGYPYFIPQDDMGIPNARMLATMPWEEEAYSGQGFLFHKLKTHSQQQQQGQPLWKRLLPKK